jgi:thioredoxin-related protein
MVLLNSSSCNLNWKPKNFKFISIQGNESSICDSKGSNGLLVLFICNHCPYVRSIEQKISMETKRIQKIGVESIAFMSNDQNLYKEDSNNSLFEQISRANFNFPYILDSNQEIGRSFDAQCTPEFYFFNKNLELNYRGRLDSNGKEPEMGNPELYYAIEEVISKGYCSTQQYPSMGCSIKWKN